MGKNAVYNSFSCKMNLVLKITNFMLVESVWGASSVMFSFIVFPSTSFKVIPFFVPRI